VDTLLGEINEEMKKANAEIGDISIEAQTPAKQKDVLRIVRECLPLLGLTGAITGGLAYAARLLWPSADQENKKAAEPRANMADPADRNPVNQVDRKEGDPPKA
jgi:hypothetical protein